METAFEQAEMQQLSQFNDKTYRRELCAMESEISPGDNSVNAHMTRVLGRIIGIRTL